MESEQMDHKKRKALFAKGMSLGGAFGGAFGGALGVRLETILLGVIVGLVAGFLISLYLVGKGSDSEGP